MEASSDEEIQPSSRKYHWDSEDDCGCADPPRHCRPRPCPCGGVGCSNCECKDEIAEVFSKVTCTHEKVCHIQDDTGTILTKVGGIESTVLSNNNLLIEILAEVSKNGGTCQPIVVNCCKDCECEEETPGVGPEPEPEPNNCDSETNQFVDGHTYTFSQYGISRKGVHQLFLGTSAINENDSDLEDKYHGNNNDPENEFTRGAWMIPFDEDDPDSTIENLIEFKCVEAVADANGLQGCQLVDNYEKCLGYQLIDSVTIPGGPGNFLDKDGAPSIRLQWTECQPEDSPDIDLLTQQVWFLEPWLANPELTTLRQTCSDRYVRKIRGPKKHNPLWDGAEKHCGCRWPKHADLDLVNWNECGNQYQFNDCVFNETDITPEP